MSNNVTRKGLAFGALVALTSTAIAGAPAFAAGEVVFVPNSGTSYNAFVTDSFTLNASLAPGQVAGNIAQLKYRIALPAALASGNGIAYKLNGGSVTASSATATTPEVISGSGSVSSANTLELAIDTNTGTAGIQAPAATADTKSVTVTAFIDSNSNNAIDAGEFNQERTVTFKKYSEVTPTVVLTQPTVGASSASATVTLADMNYTAANLRATFTGVTGATAAPGVAVNSSTGVATDGTAVTSTAVTAQAYYSGVALGTAVSATPTARTISSITANVVKGDNAIATAATTGAATTTARVRTNGSFVASVKALDLTTPTAANAAGIAVVAKVQTTATLSATAGSVKSVTVAGTTYTANTANTDFATVNVTTDASGVATVTVSSVGLAATDTVTVTFTAQNYSSAVVADFEDATYTVSDAISASYRKTAKNTAVTVNYNVADQFGVASAATNQRLKVDSTNPAATAFVAVTAGKATATITPTTDYTGTYTIDATLQESSYNSSNGQTTWSAGTVTATQIIVNVSANADDFDTVPVTAKVNNVTYNSSTNFKQALQTKAYSDSTFPVVADASLAELSFSVNNRGAEYTVSGTGLAFVIGGKVYTDTVTLLASAANGDVTVFVASNTTGTKTVTFKTGAVTKTVDVVFDAATRASGATIAVAVAAAAQAGRSIDATATVTDKFGNPVKDFNLTASVAGVASVNGGFSANVTTDANGKATVKLTAGVNDLGDAVVTFSDKGDNSVPSSAAVTAVAKTVTFGQTDGYIDVLNGKRASVTWSMAKGKRVAFLLNGVRKYNFVQTGDAELNLQFNLKKGTNNIKLIIGGVIVDDITVNITK